MRCPTHIKSFQLKKIFVQLMAVIIGHEGTLTISVKFFIRNNFVNSRIIFVIVCYFRVSGYVQFRTTSLTAKSDFVIVTSERIFGVIASETGIFVDFNSLSSIGFGSKTDNLDIDGRDFGTGKARMFNVIFNRFIVGKNIVIPLKK